MTATAWTCPHCQHDEFVPSVTDEGVGVCTRCRFAYNRPSSLTDGTTWREQAAARDDSDPLWPHIRPDRYRVIRSLASGAQGHILLAHHLHLDQICVLKVIQVREELRELATARLQAEARAGARVSHPNVARVLDCDSVGDAWYFAMEYVPGENLRRIVRGVGRLRWEQVVPMALKIADGLSAIHAAKMIHRDIKPSNLMLSTDGVPKIMDLGLVKMVQPQGDMSLTHLGQILGTPYYMPPEQFDSEKELTPQADLYSFGATLFHLLAGRPPFQGAGVVELANRHKRDAVAWPDEVAGDVPTWLRHVVEICLAKRPEHRFATAAALAEAMNSGGEVGVLLPTGDSLRRPRGILVTEFRNLSRQPEDDWIGDAVAEYLASRLREIEGLHVVDRQNLSRVLPEAAEGWSSVDETTLLDKARMLGAAVVLVGGFQRSGSQVRITVRSIEDDARVAPRVTTHVAGEADDLFGLEDQLAEAVIRDIGHKLGRASRRGRRGESEDLVAQEKFVRGRRAFADGEYRDAIRLAEEALAIDKRCAGAASLIGAAYARMGDYARAVECHQQEELAARADGDDRRLAEALGNLGVMYYYQGQYPLAFEFLEQARDLCADLRHWPDCANYEGNLGFVLMRLERWHDAEQAFNRAIEIHQRYGDLVSLAWPYNGMGGVLLKQQRYAEASEFYRRALGLAREIGDRVNVGVSHMNLGRCACLLEDYAEAEACFDEALQTLEGTDFWNGLTLVYEHMADMYLQEKNIERAMQCIDQRLALAQKHNNHRMESEAWEQKAKAHELAGEKDAAFACLKKSIEVSQKPPPEESLHRHLSMIAKKQPFA
ncbi:MAG: tetratricopeptide repeat protein [Phycisphaerales bacterium]|nr:tetratricopeptide repeat protein [Phycisphaerales bacterium]